MEYLTPFIEVIRSPEISGPITGVALTAVSRFLDAYIIGEEPFCLLALNTATHVSNVLSDNDAEDKHTTPVCWTAVAMGSMDRQQSQRQCST